MISERQYNNYRLKIMFDFQKVKIVARKDVWWCRLLDATILKWSKSQWGMATINKIIVPNRFHEWPVYARYEMLRHEREHLEQYQELGDGAMWVGWVLFAVAYTFLLPFVFTMRSMLEKDAYRETAAAMHFANDWSENPELEEWARQWYVSWMKKNFSRWEYGWMCPFKKHITIWANKAWTTAKLETHHG